MPRPNPTAWNSETLVDPHAAEDKPRRVRSMFNAIAPSYDLNNRLHSAGRDRVWRRAAVALSDVQLGDTVVDVACGTGDLALEFSRAGAGRVVGIDFTQGMLSVAMGKQTGGISARPDYICGDATQLPMDTGTADVASIAFGIRNVVDPAGAMAQMCRILRPGGRLVILEFSMPAFAPLRWIYTLYFRHIMPRTASWIARDRSGAYRYLPRSVDTFMNRPQMVALMRDAGFATVTARPVSFGIAMIYVGTKSASANEDSGLDDQGDVCHAVA